MSDEVGSAVDSAFSRPTGPLAGRYRIERTLDARTDIYALGCVLYEMLVGEPPFTGPTAQAIVARVMTEEPRSITAQRRTVPAYIETAVEVALAKLPADRFATAGEFAAALSGEATAVSRSGALGTGLRRVERRALTVTVALVAGLMFATGLAVWGWLRPRPTLPVTRSYIRFPTPKCPCSHAAASPCCPMRARSFM